MANGDKNGVVGPILKVLFGDASRFVLLGAGLCFLYFAALEFKEDVTAENQKTREILNEYIAANGAWQNLSEAERERLLKRVNARIRRLYEHNGWVYEDVER